MYLSWLHNLTSLQTNHDKAPIGKETSCAHRSHALSSCHYARSMVIWKHCRTGSQRTVKPPVWNRSLAGIPWRIHKFLASGIKRTNDIMKRCWMIPQGKLLKKYFYSAKTKCCFHPSGYISTVMETAIWDRYRQVGNCFLCCTPLASWKAMQQCQHNCSML